MPASSCIDSEEEPLSIEDSASPYDVGEAPALFFGLEEEPLCIGGSRIFVPCVGGGAPAFFFDSEKEPLFIRGIPPQRFE